MWGYAEIGARLAAAGPPEHAGYAAWIATYADPEFQALAAWARELTDAAGADAGPAAIERHARGVPDVERARARVLGERVAQRRRLTSG